MSINASICTPSVGAGTVLQMFQRCLFLNDWIHISQGSSKSWNSNKSKDLTTIRNLSKQITLQDSLLLSLRAHYGLFQYILCICFTRSATDQCCTGRTHKINSVHAQMFQHMNIYRLYALPPQKSLSGQQQLLQMFLEDCFTRLNPHFVKEVRKHATSNKTKYATTIRNLIYKHCKAL